MTVADSTASNAERCQEHHWVSIHQPGFPVFWVDRCSMCGEFSAERMEEQLAARDAQVRAETLCDAATALLATDVHEELCSYGPPGTCDCALGEHYRWLMARAAPLKA